MGKCSETSEQRIQKQENHQKERIQRSQHGESFKVEEIYQFSNYSSPLETQPEETLKPVYFAASSWLHW